MESETSFWQWIESLTRSHGWEGRDMPFKVDGHLGQDGGAHHVLPGWGKHVDEGPPPGIQDETIEIGHEEGGRPKARLGKETGKDRNVWFDPNEPMAPLANAHVTITGESGTGKTQLLKTLLADLGIPALILDFKDDYAEPGYAAKEGFSVYDPTKRPLPFNPLDPLKDPQTGEANKTFHTYQLAEIVARVYGLGEQQQFKLREAIKSAYAVAGDDLPSFDDVRAQLASDKGNGELLGRLSPIFDFGFFSDPNPEGFNKIATSNTVIRLAQLPGNEVKNAVAEFFLMALYNHLVRLQQTHLLRQVLVLDEAWRVVQSPFLEPLMREARAFGLGVLVATQFPTDLPLAVVGSAATDIYLGQSTPSQVEEVQRTIVGGTNGSEAERIGTLLRGLLPLQFLMANRHYAPYVKTDGRPYYARYAERTATVTPRSTPAIERDLPMGSEENRNLTKQGSPARVEDKCSNCGNDIYYSGMDRNVPWVHAESRNSFCDSIEPNIKGPRDSECRDCGGSGNNTWPAFSGIQCLSCGGSGLSAARLEAEPTNYDDDPDEPGAKMGAKPKLETTKNDWGLTEYEGQGGLSADGKNTPLKVPKHIKLMHPELNWNKMDEEEREDHRQDHQWLHDDIEGDPPHTHCGDDGGCGKPVSEGIDAQSMCGAHAKADYAMRPICAEHNSPLWDWNSLPRRCDMAEELDGLADHGEQHACPACKATGISHRGDACSACKGSGIFKGDSRRTQSWSYGCYFPEPEDDDEHTAAKHPKAEAAAAAKTAQEIAPADYGRFTCSRCQTPTDSEDGTCDACKKLADELVTSEETSLKERIDNARVGSAQYEDEYEHDDDYPWDGDPSGKRSRDCFLGNHSSCPGGRCGCDHHDIRHQFSGACFDEEHDACGMEGCPCGCHDGSIPGQFRCGACGGSGLMMDRSVCWSCKGKGFRGKTAAESDRPCMGCKGSGIDDADDQCNLCDGNGRDTGVKMNKIPKWPHPLQLECPGCGAEYSANPGDYWDTPDDHEFRCDFCDRGMRLTQQVRQIVGELIPFPPAEGEEEGPFAPFSMSEWQMVKGPKRRAAYERKTKDCVSCGRRIHGNEFPLDSSDMSLVADEFNMEGPDIPQCFLCSNDEFSYARGLRRALKKWKPAIGKPCSTCKGSGITTDMFETRPADYEPCYSCKGSGEATPSISEESLARMYG